MELIVDVENQRQNPSHVLCTGPFLYNVRKFRLCFCAQHGQILVSAATKKLLDSISSKEV